MSKRGTLQRLDVMGELSSLPPELLTIVFKFLPFHDLKNGLLVCRLTHTYMTCMTICLYKKVLEGSGRTAMSLVNSETEVLGGQRGRGAPGPHDARGWTPRDARGWTHWRNRRPAEGSQHGKTGDFGAAHSGLFLNCSRCFPAGVHPLPPDHP